jgi:hypothetical protein
MMGRLYDLKRVLDEQQRLTAEFLKKTCVPNAVANIGRVKRFSSVENIANFIDVRKPALVAAAGPSLANALPLISDRRDRIVLYCADAALPCLLDAGIFPDLVVNLDPEGHLLERSFDRLPDLLRGSRCALVCPVFVHPRLLELWTGKIFAYNLFTRPSIAAIDEIGRMFPHIKRVGSCPNVGHFTVNLAFTLRHAAIAWAGIDYCWHTDGRYYAPGVRHADEITSEAERIPAIDSGGRLVRTSSNFCVQAESFVEFFQVFYHRTPCYNLSRGILPFSDDRAEFEEMLARA